VTKPWLRLYRREEGSFAQLPLYVRALAAEILKLTDDSGAIRIGRKEPWEAIAFALGATAGERRMLRRDVALLLDDGFLVRDGETLRAPNFPRFQGDDTGAKPARPEHEPSVNGERTENESSTNDARLVNEPSTSGARVVHENQPKHPESFNTVNRIRVEKRREEKRDPRARRPASEALTAFEAVESTFSEMRQAAGGGPFKIVGASKDHTRIQDLVAWSEAHGSAWHEDAEAFLAPLRAALGSFLADERAKAEGWPLAWFSDPGKYLGAAKANGGQASPDAALAARQKAASDRCEAAKSEGRFDDAAKAQAEAEAIAAERRKLRARSAA
jgi:hypothetical protein